jgi:hypothetical protein
MTPIQKRIYLAEAYGGWKPANRKIRHYDTWQHSDGRRCTAAHLPRYEADLNVLHHVEVGLSDGQYDTYERELAVAVNFKCHDEWPAPSGLRLVISATAEQRANALIKLHDPQATA